MKFTGDNKLERLEKEFKQVKDKVDKINIDEINKKIISEKSIETLSGKYQKHIKRYLDIENNKLGKVEYPYNGLLLKSDNKVWLLEVDDSGDLQIIEQ